MYPYRHLKDFIDALDRAGELTRISRPVSAHLEISRYTDAESKAPEGGRALLFESVTGSAFPVATNLFGSPRRIRMALGVEDLDELGERARRYLDLAPPRRLADALRMIPLALSAARFIPRIRRIGTPPCQEVVHRGTEVELTRLPVLHCWPHDAGPFITLPLVFTRSLKTGKRNVGMYRMQVFDARSTGMHWHVHKDGSHYFSEYARAGKRMPVAVAIGADPATTYAATAPLPRGMDETLLAGFIRKRGVPLARCLTVDLEVPAEAEFVLEGYVDPEERRREGPFGDHTGYYSLADDYPVFHVTALTHRRNPIYNATLVGRPPMEDCYLAKATERLFLPMLQTVFPEIVDYWFPWEGVFHNIVVVAIDKAYPGHAQKVMSGLWGQGQMSFCKAIAVVDGDVDPKDPAAVLAAFDAHFDPTADLTITQGVLDVLDHSSPHPTFGNKLGLDLTRRLPGEPRRPALTVAGPERGPADLSDRVQAAVPGVLAVRELRIGPHRRIAAVTVDKAGTGRGGRDFAESLLGAADLTPFSVLLLFDADIDLDDRSLMLWKLFNNVDPGRDIHFADGRAAVDARRKGPADGHHREWPEELNHEC